MSFMDVTIVRKDKLSILVTILLAVIALFVAFKTISIIVQDLEIRNVAENVLKNIVVKSGSFFDPDLRDIQYPAKVLLAVPTSKLARLDRSRIVRTWRFGDLTVVLYRADSFGSLLSLYRNGIVRSAMALNVKALFPDPISKKLREFVSKYIQQYIEPAVAYPYDAKRTFHHITYRYTGRNITVCVVDSGVDYLHPDLRHAIKILVSTVVETVDGRPLIWVVGQNGTLEDAWKFDKFVYNETGVYAWMDSNAHGTHVIGIIVDSGYTSNGKYMGLAPGARIIAIKAFGRDGTASIETIMDALEWIYDNAEKYDIKVCSFSWGIAKSSDGTDPVSLAVSKIIQDKKVTIVVAMGNNYLLPYTINIPAVCHGCIAVGAMNPYTYTVAPYSSMGPTADGRIKPDFMGAGTLVVSTKPITVKSLYEETLEKYKLTSLIVDPWHVMMSGTSMATPCVASMAVKAVEYLKSKGEEPTPEKVLQVLKQWSRRINPITKDIITGYGVPQEP